MLRPLARAFRARCLPLPARSAALSSSPPDPHAPLRVEDVASKAMRLKLRRAQAEAAPPPAVLPPPPPPANYAAQGQEPPSFGAWMFANAVQGAGITLGFIVMLSIFRGVGLMEGEKGRAEVRRGETGADECVC